jgi:hypothetical protein
MALSPEMRGEGLNVGDIVIIDADMAHSGEVQIVYKTQAGCYCIVKDLDNPETEPWSVMSYRLTKKPTTVK